MIDVLLFLAFVGVMVWYLAWALRWKAAAEVLTSSYFQARG